MYTKEQASQLRQAFWTTFGQYMAPIPSAEGLRINWPNYKTGLKHIYFRMTADTGSAYIGIEITHPDPGMQELFFSQFQELKTYLHETMGEEWEWELHAVNATGDTISRIYTTLEKVNLFNREDWPALISFFKTRMVALDEFWSNGQYSFDSLR